MLSWSFTDDILIMSCYFAAGDNGLEIPLYYFLMLFALLAMGPRRYSVDQLISSKR